MSPHKTAPTIEDVCKKLDKVMETLQDTHQAFIKNSDGSIDFDGHRRYHESMIRASEAQEKFWLALKLDIAKKGLWGLLVILIGLVIVGLQTKLGIFK